MMKNSRIGVQQYHGSTGALLDARMSETHESPLLLFSWIPLPSRDSPPNTHVGNSSSPKLLLSSARTAPAPLFRGKPIETDPTLRTALRWELGAAPWSGQSRCPRGLAGALQPRTCCSFCRCRPRGAELPPRRPSSSCSPCDLS